ncbi:MAG: neocarzinostatin apoprotein domain-containing protein [Acidimicrobiales bacterium]
MRNTGGDDEAQVDTETDPATATSAPPTTVTDVLGISQTVPTTTAPAVDEPEDVAEPAAETPEAPIRATDGVEGFITPSIGIADGDVVTVSVTGLTPGRNVTATMCWEGEGGDQWMDADGRHHRHGRM